MKNSLPVPGNDVLFGELSELTCSVNIFAEASLLRQLNDDNNADTP